MIFTNPSGKRGSAMTTSDHNQCNKKEVIGSISSAISKLPVIILDTPYDFSLDSDVITSDLLMRDREKQRRLQRDKLILGSVFE